jgi:hypothetical protein
MTHEQCKQFLNRLCPINSMIYLSVHGQKPEPYYVDKAPYWSKFGWIINCRQTFWRAWVPSEGKTTTCSSVNQVFLSQEMLNERK